MSDEVALVDDLFGPLIGEQKVASWLAEQVRLIDDVTFADEFAALVQLPGGLTPGQRDVASLYAGRTVM